MKSKQHDRFLLIQKIMESYKVENPYITDKEMVEKYDKLHEIETSSLHHLAELRKIKIENFVEY